MFGEFSPWHLLIVAAVFVLLFGAKKLPDAARSLGRSARILKTELKDLREDDPKDGSAQQSALPVNPPEAHVAPVAAPAPVAHTAPVMTAPVAPAAPVTPAVPVTPAAPQPTQVVNTPDQTSV